MVEAIIVGLVLVVLIYYLIHTWMDSYKEGDYVVWFGGLYKIISVEGEFIIIEDNTSLKMVHLVEITQPRLKKVSNKFAEKYLSLKSNYEGKLELLDK